MATTKEEIGAASLSPDHLEYRRICAAIDTFEQPGYRGDEAGDAALGCLLGEADAIAERVWHSLLKRSAMCCCGVKSRSGRPRRAMMSAPRMSWPGRWSR